MGNAEFAVGGHGQQLCRRQAIPRNLDLFATRALLMAGRCLFALHQEITNVSKESSSASLPLDA
jgi:hypothetical protein